MRIALASSDGVVLLDTGSGKEVERFALQNPGVQSVTYSPDGKLLAVTGFPSGVQVLDARSGKILGKLDTADRNLGIRPVSFSADGGRIALGVQNVNVKLQVTVWDADGFKKLHALDVLPDHMAFVALAGDGKTLATWGQSLGRGQPNPDIPRTVQLWDTATGKELKKVLADGYVNSAALSRDGKQLAIVEGAATLSIWDVETGAVAHRLAARRGTAQLQYSPDGKLLAATTRDGAVQLWDVPAYLRIGMASGPAGSLAVPNLGSVSLAFLPGGKVRALGGSSVALHLWEVPSGRVLTPQDGHTSAVTAVRFSADGRKVISAANDGLRFWDAATGKSERRLDLRDPYDPFRGPYAPQVLLAPDGRSALAGNPHDNGLRVLDLATEQEQFALDSAVDHAGLSAAYSADGKTLAVAGPVFTNPNNARVVRVWDAVGHQRALLKLKPAQVQQVALAVSADGTLVLTAANTFGAPGGQNSELTLWDVATGKERWTKTTKGQTTHLAFAPDGDWVVTMGWGVVYLHDTATGTELRQFVVADGMQVLALALSPDGRSLALGGRAQNPQGASGVVRVLEMSTCKVRAEYAGHRQPVTALAFAPDGRTLASGSQDTTVLLWDLTGKLDTMARSISKPKPEEFDGLWNDLDGGDARKAYRLIQGLAAHHEAAALIRAKLPPVPVKEVPVAEIAKLIANLDSDDFETRERASKALSELGKVAAPALTTALRGEPSPEKKRRVEELLQALRATGPNLGMVRPTRALELLERLGTVEARQVLQELAKGEPNAPLTCQTKTTLKRLAAP
jgi:WD40 repeat protein